MVISDTMENYPPWGKYCEIEKTTDMTSCPCCHKYCPASSEWFIRYDTSNMGSKDLEPNKRTITRWLLHKKVWVQRVTSDNEQ